MKQREPVAVTKGGHTRADKSCRQTVSAAYWPMYGGPRRASPIEIWPDLDRMGLKIPSDRGRICSLMRSRDPTARLRMLGSDRWALGPTIGSARYCPPQGTNWSVNLLNDIVKAACNKDPSSIIPILEFGAPDKFEKLNQEPSPRVLATHLHYDNIPQKFFDKKLKMLVVFRNPKDTAVSYFHFYNNNPMLPNYSSWDTFFEDYMSGNVCWGSYFDHVLEWNKHIDDENIMIVTFEEMKEDLEAAIKKMSLFSGFSLSEEQIQSIADKGTFKSMKEKSEKTHGAFGKVLFRKGEVGDWKNIFTEAQNQEMDAKFEQCLAGTKLGEMLQYNVYCK
ncbi:hypothetical protein XELAEV_18026753mg [Xenopus laevis]|uniref:Sulfotransferase n=1 Tax=Xenopus laevis TaxID=8355 RepID=A0A974HJA9_XENLA|nr:hypothetical protein XELAEV_18026753mg [Xenopus laevis]